MRLLVALGTLVFYMLTAPGYGYFRDELYYLANAEHLDWGYVDHPPLIALIAWLTRAVLGDSLYAIRFLPAVAAAGTVYLSARMVRELGGTGAAELVSALASALAPIYLSLFTIFSMNAFDVLFWAAAAFFVIRILKTGDLRLWLAFGLVVGVALQNKFSILFFAFGVPFGLVATRDWKQFKSPWLYIGGAVSILIFSPHVLWQVTHGWPAREFIENATRFKNLALSPLGFLSELVLMMNPLLLPLWVGGLGFFLFARAGRPYRALGVAYFAVLGVMLTQNAKSYYLAPIYTMLFASGAVAFERLAERSRWRFMKPVVPAAVVISGLLLAPFAKPLLPVDTFVQYASRLGIGPASGERKKLGRLPQFFADMHGWPELAAGVARVHKELPPEESGESVHLRSKLRRSGRHRLFRSSPRSSESDLGSQ